MSETTIRSSIRIFIPKKNNSKHSCGKCTRVFKTKKEFKNHICKSHACQLCGQRFAKKCHVEQHMKCLHGPKQFICEEDNCKKRYIRKCDLDQHLLAHVNYKPFRCNICGKRFKALAFFKTHKRVHKSDATFVDTSEVESKWEDEESDSESDEEAHPVRKIRVFTCGICGKHFKRNFNMKRHFSSHMRRYFVCEVCVPEVNFETVSEREEHYKTVHSGKPFTCGECYRSYKSKYKMKDHLERKHKKEMVLVQDDSKNCAL